MMDAGEVKFYTVTDVSEDGGMPAPRLVPCSYDGADGMLFEERRISFSRQYAAMGVDQQIDRIIRIWRTPVRIGEVAVIDDTEQYRIDNVQPTTDMDGLLVTDLTLMKLEDNYDISEYTAP